MKAAFVNASVADLQKDMRATTNLKNHEFEQFARRAQILKAEGLSDSAVARKMGVEKSTLLSRLREFERWQKRK